MGSKKKSAMINVPSTKHRQRVMSFVQENTGGNNSPKSTMRDACSAFGDKFSVCQQEGKNDERVRLKLKVRKDPGTLGFDLDNQIKVEQIITSCASTK